ncbi:MAG: hypothetical protein HQM16_00370 [Deltaproteobacteria bacterium]|nr:hypothetical protein [Deltaproteobacteria bacterium]
MIKKILLIAVLFSLCANSAEADDQPDWIQYQTPDDLFSILLPAEPQFSFTVRAEYTVNTVLSESGDTQFKIIYSIHSTELSQEDKQLFIDNTKSILVNTKMGTVKSEKKITVKKNAGVEISFVTQDQQYICYRIFFNANTLYTLGVISKHGFSSKKDNKRFFDSFNLSEHPQSQSPVEQDHDSIRDDHQKTNAK